MGFPVTNYSTPAQLGPADMASRQVRPMARLVCHKRGSPNGLALPRAHRPDVEHTNPQVTAGGKTDRPDVVRETAGLPSSRNGEAVSNDPTGESSPFRAGRRSNHAATHFCRPARV